jgi:SAM-dependent methyltransferase
MQSTIRSQCEAEKMIFLDLGCGTGTVCWFALLKKYPYIFGVDIKAAGLKHVCEERMWSTLYLQQRMRFAFGRSFSHLFHGVNDLKDAFSIPSTRRPTAHVYCMVDGFCETDIVDMLTYLGSKASSVVQTIAYILPKSAGHWTSDPKNALKFLNESAEVPFRVHGSTIKGKLAKSNSTGDKRQVATIWTR